MIKKEVFGEIKGQKVFIYTLDNGCGLIAEIITYGGILKSLYYQGTDVVLGRDTVEDYLQNDGCLGALIGRNSNRLANAEFELNGKTYRLCKNDGNNNLHGGEENSFRMKIWDAIEQDGIEPALILSLQSPDGEEGFPGNAEVEVTYTLTKENVLQIDYQGSCDTDTLMNLTNHSYFNMNGHDSGAVDGHSIQLDCDFYTPNTDECMPTGEILSVNDTAFDLRAGKKMEEVFASQENQIAMFGGFDHNFCLRGRGYRKAGSFTGEKTGICMEIYTDLPGIQIYSGNWLNEEDVYKNGALYVKHQGVCFETQAFPNAMATSHFPSIILRKGEIYRTTTAFRFI